MTTIEKLDMNVKQVNSDFVAIKNKIVEKGVEVADGTRTAEYADKIDDVYEAGKKSQYDEFWDSYQHYYDIYGQALVYTATYIFAGEGWTDETFTPKHSMASMTRADYMFASSYITDLKGILEKRGITFSFAKCVNFQYTFYYAKVTAIPEINTTAQTDGSTLTGTFAMARELHTIDKLVLKDNGLQKFSNVFQECNALENLTIEGTIGQNGFNVQWSTNLSKDSITSIINALSSTTSGLSITLSKAAVDKAWEAPSGANNGTLSFSWAQLIGTKPNWTISLV